MFTVLWKFFMLRFCTMKKKWSKEIDPITFSSRILRQKIQSAWEPDLFWITQDILFLSNHNIHKNSVVGLCFWASDPLIE